MIEMPGQARASRPRPAIDINFSGRVQGNLFVIPSVGDPVDLSLKLYRHAIPF